jgi:DNA-binding NtrC family response regulator
VHRLRGPLQHLRAWLLDLGADMMPSPMSGSILVVDDDPFIREVLATTFAAHGLRVETCASALEALGLLAHGDHSVVLTDLQMPGMRGEEFCRRVADTYPDLPVVVMTAHASLDTAVEALRAGAYDYFSKPLHIESAALRLQRIVEERHLRAEVKRLRETAGTTLAAVGVIGDSPVMKSVYDLLARVCRIDASVLITGETGTGKEVVARILHDRSPRCGGPFVAVNCSAVPEGLFESELFGHVRGAFTDARGERPGLLVQARGGSLFLDEFGDLPLAVQPKLLRALEERQVRPVGASSETATDLRLITATNLDLEGAIAGGKFREDLFFRVNVIHVHLPPLRSRGNDVLQLAQHFIRRFAAEVNKQVVGLRAGAAELLLAYPWPGNVRELRNSIERAVVLTSYDHLGPEDLPPKIREHRSQHVLVASDDPTELLPLDEVEHRYILRVLEAAGGNKTLAAKILGLDRKTLHRKLERRGADPT